MKVTEEGESRTWIRGKRSSMQRHN